MSCVFFFFKQKTAYEMRISDWSSDVCSSDLDGAPAAKAGLKRGDIVTKVGGKDVTPQQSLSYLIANVKPGPRVPLEIIREGKRSEEHTSELQSLMRLSYAVFCLPKKIANLLNYGTYRPTFICFSSTHSCLHYDC